MQQEMNLFDFMADHWAEGWLFMRLCVKAKGTCLNAGPWNMY